MKIVKSGALAAFAALALMASHGSYAGPKGRSLSAIGKLFALMKGHPVKSSTLGLGALGASLYLSSKMYKGIRLIEDKKKKLSELKGVKSSTIAITTGELRSDDFKRDFDFLVKPLEGLVEATQAVKVCFSCISVINLFYKIALDLIGFKNRNSKDYAIIAVSLAKALNSARGALGAGAPKEETEGLIRELMLALESVFSRATDSAETALGKNHDLISLVGPFRAFADAVKKNIDNLNLEDTDNSGDCVLLTAIGALKDAASKGDLSRLLEDLDSACFFLSRNLSGFLKNSAQDLKTAIQSRINELKKRQGF